MHRAQEQVRDFHRANGLRIVDDDKPVLDWDDLKGSSAYGLIVEEAKEVWRAIMQHDTENFIQELCDLLYVTYGMAVRSGIDLEPFYEEIHRTNMAKCSGPVREDGKKLKPEGWKPPNLKEVIHKRYGVLRLTEVPRRVIGQ